MIEVQPPPDSVGVLMISTDKTRTACIIGKSIVTISAALAIAMSTQGADLPRTSRHWAYVAPVRPVLPEVKDTRWPRNSIDRFTLARMEAEGLHPSSEADRETLIRRVTFALVGLPPTLDEIDTFVNDDSPDAFERLVDRLLGSPRYGERMAVEWLDLARYADTHGYHTDAHRDMWRYRDWVAEALNANLPFDQFTVWQLAGDLLPNPSLNQRIASGFNRNHMVNSEEGAIAEEYRTAYVADRVATTATVWLGQTMDCARCHDHKYDPFTQREYYQLFAFFNNVDEAGLGGRHGNEPPLLSAPTRLQQEELRDTHRQIAALESAMRERAAASRPDQLAWEKLAIGDGVRPLPPDDAIVHLTLDDRSLDRSGDDSAGPEPFTVEVRGDLTHLPGKLGEALLFGGETELEVTGIAPFLFDRPMAISAWVFPTTADRMTIACRAAETTDGKRRGWVITLDDRRPVVTIYPSEGDAEVRITAEQSLELYRWHHLIVNYDVSDDAKRVSICVDGRAAAQSDLRERPFDSSRPLDVPLRLGKSPWGEPMRGFLDDVQLFERALSTTESQIFAGSNPIQSLIAIAPESRYERQADMLRRYYLEHHDAIYRDLTRQLRSEQRNLERIELSVPTCMIMNELDPRRETFVLERGDYRLPTDRVEPDVPASLPPLADQAPRNRLGLAKWVVDARNPLTSRVIVNHFWRIHFGRGLVATPEDFGTRGQPPTHPELLDWLAVEFIESGWDVKHLQRLIVTSATFRQTNGNALSGNADPENRWLARGPRVRLSAEMIRDASLATADLLDNRIGGVPVFPYQPPGLWEEVSYNPNDFTAQAYTESRGADLFRRSLYTFWKRSAPPPSMVVFDATDRTICTARRDRTLTPLQSLVLMNDPTYVEAARHIALRAVNEPASDMDSRIEYLFRLVTSRRPNSREISSLRKLLDAESKHFRTSPDDAELLLSVGHTRISVDVDAAELAAWTMLASSLLNTHEAITRP